MEKQVFYPFFNQTKEEVLNQNIDELLDDFLYVYNDVSEFRCQSDYADYKHIDEIYEAYYAIRNEIIRRCEGD